ncbi:MAG: hypothetical protein J6I80_01280 [Clostridia bacterium]|nr:hypothetical protein [Clostridia bacterium]
MIPVFGIDVTENKENDQWNAQVFLAAKPSDELKQSLDKESDIAFDTVFKKVELPLVFRILQWIFGLAGLCITMACARTVLEDDISIKQIYAQLPWLFWLAGASIVIWAVITFFAKRKEKAVMESDEREQNISRIDSLSTSIYAELGVSEETDEVDVLSFEYKIKDGEIKPYKKALEDMVYTNYCFNIFADDENVYLASLDGKFKFARTSLKTIHKINKKIMFFPWNKDEDYNKGEYKKYKMHEGEMLNIYAKGYYVLEFERNGESWGIYFPEYELETFEELTGLKAE